MKNFAIVFDFDGVIINSIDECYYVGVEAYNRIGGNLKFCKKTKNLYKKARPYIRITEDHLPTFYMIEKGFFDPSLLKTFKKNLKRKEKEYVKKFYEIRKDFQKKDFKGWLSMHKPFYEIVKFMKKNIKRWNIFISTTKNKEAVKIILKSISFKFQPSKIFSREFSTDKSKHIKEISKRYGIEEEKIIFIDDNLENLINIKRNTKAIPLLASWGYINKEILKNARKNKIKIINKNEFEKEIVKIINNSRFIIHKTVSIIIKKDNRFILVKRANKPEKNFWAFPGGHVEKGERIIDAAKREALEEVGKVLIKVKPLFYFSHDVKIFHKHICYCFLGEISGKIKPGGDAKKVGFFTVNQMKNMNLTNYTIIILNKLAEEGFI